MQIDKAAIVATLLSRGLKERADWADRELPRLVDTYTNAALLKILNIDPTTIPPATSSGQGAAVAEPADSHHRSNSG